MFTKSYKYFNKNCPCFQPEYIKEAKSILEQNKLSLDAPQFAVAKDAMKKLSDVCIIYI